MAPAEVVAAAFGAAYILLAIRERRACWVAGGVSTAIYAAVFLDAGLPLQAGLQVLYVAMAAYGFFAWQRDATSAAPARSWPPSGHLVALAGVGLATALSAPLAARYAAAAVPVADALGTWASLVATWLLARRVIESWLWWIAVDAGLAALYFSQGLLVTAALYLGFAALAVAGWRSWRMRAAPA